ncbi:unnamed protein product [Caenorhabditis brenneri]
MSQCIRRARAAHQLELEIIDATRNQRLISQREAANRLRDLGEAFNEFIQLNNFHEPCRQTCLFNIPAVRPTPQIYDDMINEIINCVGQKYMGYFIANNESKQIIVEDGLLEPTIDQITSLVNMHLDGRTKFKRNKTITIDGFLFDSVTIRDMFLKGVNGNVECSSMVTGRSVVFVYTFAPLDGHEERAIKNLIQSLAENEQQMID